MQSIEPRSLTWRVFRVTLITVATLAAMAVAAPFLLIYGLPLLPPQRDVATGSSVEAVRDALPGLQGLEILACSYTAMKEQRHSMVPSPYNTMYEFYGWVTLTPESAAVLRGRGSWNAVQRFRVPSSLRNLLPTGTSFVSCDEVDDTFSNLRSSHFCRVVMPTSGDTVYFITRDDDHGFQD